MSTQITNQEKSWPYVYDVKLSIVFTLILLLSLIINAMDRIVFVMLVPAIKAQYGFALSDVGLLATCFSLGIGLAAYPIGVMSDKTSRKNLMIMGMVIYSVFTFATALSVGFWDMLIYRIITGFGESMQLGALYAVMGSYYYKNKGASLGVASMGVGLGIIVGPIIGTKIVAATGNWQTPFFVYGILGIIIAGIVLLFVPKKFTEAKEIKTTESNSMPAQNFDHVPENFWNRNVILMSFCAAAYGIVASVMAGFYPTYMMTILGFKPVSVSYLYAFLGFGGLVGPIGGYIGDKFGQKRTIQTVWVVLAILSILLFNFVKEPWVIASLLFVFGAAGTGTVFPNHAALMQKSARPSMIGRASGAHNLFMYTTSGFAGYIFGAVATAWGWSVAGTLLIAGMAVIPLISVTAIKTKQQW